MITPLDFLFHLFVPLRILAYSAYYLPITVFKLIFSLQFRILLSPSAFKDLWFANFWKSFGPAMKVNTMPVVKPLMSIARGVVLDVGPGTGEWLNLFDKRRVTKIYGVEPNRDHHALLRERIIQAGLSDIYQIVPVGIEDLDGNGLYGGEAKEGGWVEKGEIDSVVTILCLCSVPQPKELIRGMYSYLKKGGIWIVCEHVKMTRGGVVKWYQALLDLIWPHFMGGCSITRDTENWLKEAGSWSKVELEHPVAEPSYRILPTLLGVLTK